MTTALNVVAALALGLLVLRPGPVAAQDQALVDSLRTQFRAAAESSDLGNAFQALTIFGATPGISAATYYVDDEPGSDLSLSSIKLSPSYTFEPVFAGLRPHVEATLGYLTAHEKEALNIGPPGPTRILADYRAITALAGAGVAIDLAPGTVMRPLGLIGYSHLSSDSAVAGPFSREVALAGRGIILDVEIDSLLLGAALEVEHRRSFDGDINLLGKLRYNQILDIVLSASDPVLETEGSFGVLTAGLELDGPTPATVFGRELRWIGFASGTWLPGDQGDAIGFSAFLELGVGLELVDRDIVGGIEGLSLRTSAIIGDGVVGWSAGLSLEF